MTYNEVVAIAQLCNQHIEDISVSMHLFEPVVNHDSNDTPKYKPASHDGLFCAPEIVYCRTLGQCISSEPSITTQPQGEQNATKK